MNPRESVQIDCPYCGETLDITIDAAAGRQHYIEDCQVCCRPMQLRIAMTRDGLPRVDASREDD